MNDTDTPAAPASPHTNSATFAKPFAACPTPPPAWAQGFRHLTITRRLAVAQGGHAEPAVAQLKKSAWARSLPHGEAAWRAFDAAVAWRKERVRAQVWLDYVNAADAHAWNEALLLLSRLRRELAAYATLHMGAKLPLLHAFLQVRSESKKRSLARAKAAKSALARNDSANPVDGE